MGCSFYSLSESSIPSFGRMRQVKRCGEWGRLLWHGIQMDLDAAKASIFEEAALLGECDWDQALGVGIPVVAVDEPGAGVIGNTRSFTTTLCEVVAPFGYKFCQFFGLAPPRLSGV